jgi:hypothetical protein
MLFVEPCLQGLQRVLSSAEWHSVTPTVCTSGTNTGSANLQAVITGATPSAQWTIVAPNPATNSQTTLTVTP